MGYFLEEFGTRDEVTTINITEESRERASIPPRKCNLYRF
jgi:hypothetical protein